MQHGPKEELRVAALCAEALPLAADLPLKKYASEGEHRASEKLASWVFGQKSLPCFRAVEQLSGKLRWGCENSSEKTVAGSAVTIDGATYTLDNAGNRTAKTDQRTAVATSYGYDNIYQLLSATQGATTTESYTYDPVGNRTASLGVASYTTNSSNEMTANSNASFTYDNNGNTTSKTDSTGTTNYTWDFENRLTQVTLPGSGGTVQFSYDPFGRRIKKVSSAGTSIFVYDADNLIEETNSAGAVAARYSQTQNIDEPLAMLRSGGTSYYQADGLWSITSLSNASGAISDTYTFDSFGRTSASTGTTVNPFRYTTRELDSETGLYFYRARYYDPSIGRFLSEDPLQFLPGENFYRYVDNNPVFWRDASGLSPSGPAAVLVPSSVLPGRRKLEGDLDPLCRKGRNLALDASNLLESLATREDEIRYYANHPDPNMRLLAGDPGHIQRIENELDTLARCRENEPKCEPEPKEFPVPFKVPDAWKRQPAPAPAATNALAGVTVVGVILVIGFVLLF